MLQLRRLSNESSLYNVTEVPYSWIDGCANEEMLFVSM
jgi:hypothetical protein